MHISNFFYILYIYIYIYLDSKIKENPDSWKEVNLNDFMVTNHHLSLETGQDLLPHAINVGQADINLNLDISDTTTIFDIIDNIGKQLDIKYHNFEYYYFGAKKYHLFADETGVESNWKNKFVIINQSTNQALERDAKLSTLGEWASYNLTFKNLLNGTSFNFSLNLTHFSLDVFGVPHSIIFNFKTSPSINHLYTIWNNQANYFNDVDIINFNQMLTATVDNITENVADFGTDAAAAFFLNQIHYHYWFYTYIYFPGYKNSYILQQNPDYSINLQNLNQISESDLEDDAQFPAVKYNYSYGKFGLCATWCWNLDQMPSNDIDMSSTDNQSAFFYYPPGDSISQQDICLAFDSADGTEVYIDNQAMAGADYMPRYYKFDYRAACWPATSFLTQQFLIIIHMLYLQIILIQLNQLSIN